jgi:ribosome maturation factor RimP
MRAASPERLRAVVAPVVAAAGLDLEDLAVSSAGRRRLLRVAVDRDGGVSLDEVAVVSQRLSEVLDDADVMGGQQYVLEVGSPGVGRPLVHERHWRRAVGRLVAVTVTDGSQVVGRLLAVESDVVVLDVPGGDRRLPFDQVASARVEVDLSGRGASDGAAADEVSLSTDEEG